MQSLKRFRKWVETINTYYAFTLLVYGAALYVASNSALFLWICIGATPLLAVWTGYLLRAFVERRTHRHGFQVLSDQMIYEINGKGHYTLRYCTKLKATVDHLMVYPVGYQWTGQGLEGVPKLSESGQQLLSLLQRHHSRGRNLELAPYETMTVSTEGDWHYWFIAFNPPVHKGSDVEIKYSQDFQDKKGVAKPHLYYFVRTSMEKLELSVKFPANASPKNVTSSYIKSTDPNRPYLKPGVVYDHDRQWATWTILRPRRGYGYRISWQ